MTHDTYPSVVTMHKEFKTIRDLSPHTIGTVVTPQV